MDPMDVALSKCSSIEDEPRQVPVDAGAPFDRGDVILRSADNVDFHFHKLLLSLASSFFSNMFSLPQPGALDNAADRTKQGLPIIPVAEKSIVLRKLLGFCSPVYDTDVPALENLDIVMSVLDAAEKYDMKRVGGFIVRMITAPRFLEEEAMRVFAIACRYRSEEETLIAARYMLRFAVWEPGYVSELDFISGSDFQRLVKYHASCGQAMNQLTLLWSTYPLPLLDCKFCRKKGVSRLPPKEYQDSVIEALRTRPSVESLLKPEWIDDMVKRAGSCISCRESAPGKFAEYAKKLALPVMGLILEIPLDINFRY
ncbi:uncharacterized protein EDB91DRAFT_1329974 [Suillus paluster]|uniref:uncharacterized protein n=1 Tax=Suillus paluster TaxID=48578 RepID=UPI001B880686|nr:uncharacterized protein EDB91DRAFT_1329974 [Suillus paluster]KAG1734079.1 hypothetical protein EDB91DRAFT_1329974 [Suillus paluster]